MTFIGVREAAEILKFRNVQSIYNLVHNGELGYYKMQGRRQLLFDRDEVEAKAEPKKFEALMEKAEQILNRNSLTHN